MNIFQATGQILTAFTNAFVVTATTVEKTVKLVEREVDNLEVEQEIRLDEVKAKRIELQNKRNKLLEVDKAA